MTAREAIKGLRKLSKEFSGYKPNEEMFGVAIAALEKEAWREEHPVSPLQLQLKKHSNQPTEDNSCIYCNNRMSRGEYLE